MEKSDNPHPAEYKIIAQKTLNIDEFKTMEFKELQYKYRFRNIHWSCFLCTYMNRAFSELVEHLANVHSVSMEYMSFRCTFCGRCFNDYVLFLKHIRLIHVSHIRNHCDLCKEKLVKPALLAAHRESQCPLLSSTLLPRVFYCRYCSDIFSNKHDLKNHLEFETGQTILDLNFHDLPKMPEKGFPCKYCGRRYRSPYQRSSHENIHSGAKLFTCCKCFMAFLSKHLLRVHQRRLCQGTKDLEALTFTQTKTSKLEEQEIYTTVERFGNIAGHKSNLKFIKWY